MTNKQKIRLIRKYTRIRARRFWWENKEDFYDLCGAAGLVFGVPAVYTLLYCLGF